jgi:hypothetical protein
MVLVVEAAPEPAESLHKFFLSLHAQTGKVDQRHPK